MKSYDYRGVHVFAPDGSGHTGTYCLECLPAAHPEIDHETSERVAPIFADSEVDVYPCCEGCLGIFDYVNLTGGGE